ncbi:MAG: SDR family oxidoreductase [Gaiellaceae bacterium MAG52_C11]|nr:SDR family oxidoreductase [Candidatus Gaiellasilicea maunaloa]
MVGRRQLGGGGEAVRAGELTRALLTGGTGKLGAAVARRLEAEGWSVLAAGRADGDLSHAAAAAALVARSAEELGGLDVVVNGASAGFEPTPFEDVTEAQLDAALGATVKGSFFVTQAAAEHLRRTRGLVVMLEDVAAYQPWPSFAAHSAAKAAQAMLTRTLADALAPEIRVCGIAPGPVAVEPEQEERRAAETLVGRVGSPDDVVAALLYLASARFVTGTTLVVDGGRLLQSRRGASA